MITTEKISALRFQRCSLAVSRCMKYLRCAKTCTTPDATTTQAVTLRGNVGYMTRPKGITVRITEMMKPTMYERLVPWLVPALL